MPKGAKLPFPVNNEELPEGRLVQGDVFELSTKDKMGNLRTVKNGPNTGQPSPQLIVVVAYAKNDPKWLALKQHWKNKAAEDFPQFFPQGPNGACTHPNFAYKWQDGDGFDGDGKPNSAKEGWAGHDVVRYTSGFAAKVYHKDHYAPQEEVFRKPNEAHPCPRGFFVRVCGTAEGNGDLTRPGMFLNASLVEISRPGPEIRTGPNAAAAFGGGGGTAPTTDALVMNNGQSYEAFKAAGWSDDQMIAAGHATRAAPPPPAPPPAAPPAPPPAAGPTYVMGSSANGMPREAWIAAGWTDEALVAAGHMTIQAPAVAAPPPPTGVAPPPAATAYTQGVAGSSGIPAPGGVNGGVTPSPSNPPPPPYSGYMQTGAAPPPPPAGRVMLPAAQGQTYEALTAAGWTEAQLVQHGMMQA